ncbi:hypothetical protein Hanom_Chr09g00783931 [Helianthus anomalus]
MKLRCSLFLRSKIFAVCGPHLQTSVEEDVDQTSAVCKKKLFVFNVCRLLKQTGGGVRTVVVVGGGRGRWVAVVDGGRWVVVVDGGRWVVVVDGGGDV